MERGSPHSLCLLESGKVGIVVPRYYSPKPTLTLTSYLGQNFGLGEDYRWAVSKKHIIVWIIL